MARRKRSLLGASGRASAPPPVPDEGGADASDAALDALLDAIADAPTPDGSAATADEAASAAEAASADEAAAAAASEPSPDPADALVEDDEPLVGSEIVVPPLDPGEDVHRPPAPAVGALHRPSVEPPMIVPPGAEPLVLFDEEPWRTPLPDPVVHVEDLPPGFSSGEGLPSGTPEIPALRARAPSPVPGLADDDWFRDADGDLPTEEFQPTDIEDFASLYRAPMNVPEPPPIPGILDRFTPAPTRPIAGGAGAVDSTRPEFVPTPPDAGQPPPVVRPRSLWDEPEPGAPSRDGGRRPAAPPPPRDVPFWQDPVFLAIVGAAVVFAVVLLLGMVWVLGRPPQTAAIEPASITPIAPTVGVPPQVARPPVDLAPLPPPVDPTAARVGGDPAVAPADPGAAAPVQPAVAPAITPSTPPPRPRPRVTADKPGRIQVRTTRAALVYINGSPVGMSPVDVERPPGVYTVHITDKGKRVEQRVDLDAGATRTLEF